MAKTAAPMTAEERKVIFASSLGTVFEWYDFYLYGSLAAIIAKQFFAGLDAGSAFIFALLAFAAGFIVRPFGALVFGRLGDLIGRKYTFLVTMTLMGIATFIVGLLPNYNAIGMFAPIAFIMCRLVQGLAHFLRCNTGDLFAALTDEFGGLSCRHEFGLHGERCVWSSCGLFNDSRQTARRLS